MQVSVFPAASLNVYVTCVAPTGNWSPEECVCVRVGAAPELSVACIAGHVAVPNEAVVGTWTVIVCCGQFKITGG